MKAYRKTLDLIHVKLNSRARLFKTNDVVS